MFFFVMSRLPPKSTRTDTLFPTRRSSDLQLGPEGMRQTEAFFRRAGITIEPVTLDHGELARQAFLDFGKGRHKAGLNFGGCFRSEEHTSELQSLMRTSYAVFCL